MNSLENGTRLDSKGESELYHKVENIVSAVSFKNNSARNVLAYSEHNRWDASLWNAYFLPLPFECCYAFENKEAQKKDRVHKNEGKKFHACMVGYYHLDELGRVLNELCKRHSIDRQNEFYNFDMTAMDSMAYIAKEMSQKSENKAD